MPTHVPVPPSAFDWSPPSPTGWHELLHVSAWIATPLLLVAIAALIWEQSRRRTAAHETRALQAELRQRKAADSALRHASTHARLTNLPTRTEFNRRVDVLLEQAGSRGGTIVALRLTNLKEITSVLGYRARELTIYQFAARLAHESFPLVADLRRGNFGFFVHHKDKQALQATFRHLLTFQEYSIEPQIAAGMAHTNGAHIHSAELLRQAETALMSSGKYSNRITSYTKTQEPNRDDLILVRDFKQFGHNDIRAVFQPQFDAHSSHPVGMEALVRWTHPTLGPISPARFIPLLEQAGLASLVTTHMLDAAINMARECRQAETPMRVSVNVSARELLDHDIPALVDNRLRALGGDADTLAIEVTETDLIDNPERAARIFTRLRDMGVACSIDDFGTGYSSLIFLGDFPLSELKIDQTFVSTMADNSRYNAIVRWTIQLAHELGLRVVAEGVEDDNTLQTLDVMGCDCIQGYVLGRPMSASGITSLLASCIGGHLNTGSTISR